MRSTEYQNLYKIWSCPNVCKALTYLFENILLYLVPSYTDKIVGISLGTNCAKGGRVVQMVMGKLPVPGCPTNLDNSKAMCACTRCGWASLDFFFSSIISHCFLPLSSKRPDKGGCMDDLQFHVLFNSISVISIMDG